MGCRPLATPCYPATQLERRPSCRASHDCSRTGARLLPLASLCCSDILHELHQKGELKQLLEGVKQAED